MKVILLLIGIFLCMGCSNVDTVTSPTGVVVTRGDAGLDTYASIAHLYAERRGFYLFGSIPFVRADLGWGIDQMVKEAKVKGANGVLHLEYELEPPHFFDWWPHIKIKGTAVTFKE